MSFSKDLKACDTIESCQKLLDSELKRLRSLVVYRNDKEKLEQRIERLLTDINDHLVSNNIDGHVYVVDDYDDVIDFSKTTILEKLRSFEFYKNLFYWLSPAIIGFGLVITLGSIFKINSVSGHSMDPTLKNGSYVISNKYAKLDRFDVVIAQELDKNGKPYGVVKRIIGMPGDKIEYKDDVLYVNGEEVDEPYLHQYLDAWEEDRLESEYSFSKDMQQRALYSKAFTTQEYDSATGLKNEDPAVFTVEVPTTGYYLIGDNRLVSKDSRELGAFPRENIIGEVIKVLQISKKEK